MHALLKYLIIACIIVETLLADSPTQVAHLVLTAVKDSTFVYQIFAAVS